VPPQLCDGSNLIHDICSSSSSSSSSSPTPYHYAMQKVGHLPPGLNEGASDLGQVWVSFQKIPHLVDRLGSAVWVGASFKFSLWVGDSSMGDNSGGRRRWTDRIMSFKARRSRNYSSQCIVVLTSYR